MTAQRVVILIEKCSNGMSERRNLVSNVFERLGMRGSCCWRMRSPAESKEKRPNGSAPSLSGPDKEIRSTGFQRLFPAEVARRRRGEALPPRPGRSTCWSSHAERNAIYNAAPDRRVRLRAVSCMCRGFPCVEVRPKPSSNPASANSLPTSRTFSEPKMGDGVPA